MDTLATPHPDASSLLSGNSAFIIDIGPTSMLLPTEEDLNSDTGLGLYASTTNEFHFSNILTLFWADAQTFKDDTHIHATPVPRPRLLEYFILFDRKFVLSR